MIGVFDSGLGGLTVLRALAERFPAVAFTSWEVPSTLTTEASNVPPPRS